MQTVGQVQPIIVRPLDANGTRFQIVAGERRWRAAKAAGLAEISAIVRSMTDAEALQQMLVENLQRKNLNPIEKARLLKRLCSPTAKGGVGMTQARAGEMFSMKQSSVANLIKLLKLPPAWQARAASGEIAQPISRLLVSFINRPEVLEAIEADMKANPWAWRTYREFDRSLKLLVEQFESRSESEVSEPEPPTPRAIPTAAAHVSAPAPTRPAAAPKTPAAQPGPNVDASQPAAATGDVEAICEAVALLTSIEQLDRVRWAVHQRREELLAVHAATVQEPRRQPSA